MSEGAKTITFIVVALVLAGAAYLAQPRQDDLQTHELVGKELFDGFVDPNKATRLKIARYDEDLDKHYSFEVAKNNTSGHWSIPSHDNYPADAEEQMKTAAMTLVGLKVLDIATEQASEHEMYGVFEPKPDETTLGDKGIGILIAFEDEKGDDLAELIIGKTVKGNEAQRFVRIPGQDVVYVVDVDPTNLSTKFEDWIEEDLLQLNAFDIERMVMKDYSVIVTTSGPRLELRSDASVVWNATDNKWEMDRLVAFRGSEAVPVELLPTEELDSQKLNDAKSALDDLKIADVRRKPAGLGGNLKADASFMEDSNNRRDLLDNGFYPSRNADNEYELLSANGEIHVIMKEGYRCILRFGGVEGTSDDIDAGLNRYMFVAARLDEDKFPMPELEALPSGPQPADDTDFDATDSEAADAAADDAAAGDGDADAEKAEDAEQDIDEERRLATERDRIEKDNLRKMDEWRENKQKAENQVRDLNIRFADWYYVIAEDEYRKIHLSREDIIVESDTAAEEGFGVDSFRQLEESGLNTDSEAEVEPALDFNPNPNP